MKMADEADELNVELKAGALLEFLVERLPRVAVEYQCRRGMHEFLIAHSGSRIKITFDVQTLLRKSMADLRSVADRVADRVMPRSVVWVSANTLRT
jgi:hypothetical protein